ncbi:putative 12-oxophytodienoate reductase 11 [Hypsibius exemplaris]|uniref:12-oxophytodienoate reductase 11 n=1 Tax=Hypsibius exemplaris TaxID=2072580 RepID=A0A1W0XAX6_HYPEX|nr:putative 12-oxophytodienoate reductase 11 [Hypsibius exemplaris]
MSSYTDQSQFWDLSKHPISASGDGLPALFTPMTVGGCHLSHRILLAPLTRMRATSERVPCIELFPNYYQQRATKGGLLISESTSISQQGTAYFRTPGIYTDDQIEAWKPVTKAVRDRGAFFFLQLWHVGRVSHSQFQPDAQPPVAPSPIALPGSVRLPDGSTALYEVPRELTSDEEIPAIVEDYRRATLKSAEAGFDGVEIQAANGYLIDQFFHDGSNTRTDSYGGSVENRCRFFFEILDVVTQAWKEAVGSSSPHAGNVGIRFSPFGTYNAMSDSNETELFRYIMPKLNDYRLAYIHINDQRAAGSSTLSKTTQTCPADPLRELCRIFRGPLILAGGYYPVSANEAILTAAQQEPSQEVAVAFGRVYISNPDLPLRVLLGAPIVHYDRSTFYTHESVGYTDQPFLTEEEIQARLDTIREELEDNPKLFADIQALVKLLKH